MIAFLRRIPRPLAWVILALVIIVLVVFGLWRHAARLAREFRNERDSARASAEREREVAAKIAAAEERAQVRREEIAARLEEARAKHARAVEDRVEAEHRIAVEVAETGSAAAEVNRRRHPQEKP